jgi:hypothetical protein
MGVPCVLDQQIHGLYQHAGHRVGSTAVLRRSNQTEAKNLLTQIHNLLRVYNARVSIMSLAERSTLCLDTLHFAQRLDGTATTISHDSPAWAAITSPALPSIPGRIRTADWHTRPIHPASRTELRAYFLRKGGDKREAWRRFPPGDAAERAQCERDCAPRNSPTKLDPFEKAARAAARKRGVPCDAAFIALFRREQAELDSPLEDLL